MTLYWLLLIVLGFGIPEGIAIAQHRTKDTFSASWWKWLGLYEGKFRMERRITGAAFFLMLNLHFLFGLHAWPWLILPAVPLGVIIILSTMGRI